MAQFKIIDTKLLSVHNVLSPEFWVNHDIENCSKCQEMLRQ